jgi:hypothetical protein
VDPVERGLFATREIKQGETVVFCPESIVFTTEKGKDTEFGKFCVADTKVADGQLSCIDYLMFNFLSELGIAMSTKESNL